MLLVNLSVKNIGLFRGRHDFDLTPARGDEGARRNLVIFKGQNGVGKSTLFQSLSLALHGPLSTGDPLSRQSYNESLLKRFHRSDQGDRTSPDLIELLGENLYVSREAHVALTFEYVQSGLPRRIEVRREWQRDGAVVKETLKILCDGNPPDVDERDYQAWLNDLVPPGLSALCFFDAERLNAFSSDQDSAQLGQSLRRLLGLDLVERLQTDLEQYALNKGGGRKAMDRLRAEVTNHQTTVDSLNFQISQLKVEIDALAFEQQTLEAKMQEQERRLAAEGGDYAARRPILQERVIVLEREIGLLENQLREMCADLLPFALAPQLCLSLDERLKQESRLRATKASDALWQERLTHFKETLESERVWRDLKVTAKDRKTLTRRLASALKKTEAGAGGDQKFVHDLSEPESEKLRGWIAQATTAVPQQVKAIGVRLRELKEEKRRAESDLGRAPDDAAIAPIYLEVTLLRAEIEKAGWRQAELREQMGALQFQRDDAERRRQRAADEWIKLQKGEKQVALAERSRAALRVYRDALTREKLAALEKALAASFNRICRKEHLLESVSIDADSFRIALRGASKQELSLSDFSAGERQLYALALLWALREVSGKQLPLAIDTPLARLDEVHRQRIISDYIPAVSEQVLLFVTDPEIDEAMMKEAEPRLARVYRLSFLPSEGYSQVRCDSEMPRGIMIYRGETPGEIELDVHGGYGETWMADYERATCYGQVKRAVLPANAKRLVLVDSDTGDYKWENIAELERITKNKSIIKSLKKAALYDVWRDGWTEALQRAGYDSIATVNIEGAEEYVLNPSKLIYLNGKVSK